MMLAEWENRLSPLLPEVTAIRRSLHRHPELSGREEATSALVRARLEGMGFAVWTVEGSCSLAAELVNGEGPCVAVRADLDALPVQERSGYPYPSEEAGAMHACGHDVHTALALGSAMWFSAHREEWQGTLRWLFEAAEETRGDAQLLRQQGFLQGCGAVLGQHVAPGYPLGAFRYRSGAVCGASDDVVLTIHGTPGHGAYPETGRDAILMAGHIISALQALVSRETSPFDPIALTFGRIEGGRAGNILCDRVTLTGTLRTLNAETRSRLHGRIRAMAEGVAGAMEGRAEVQITPSYPPLCNDPRLTEAAADEARRVLGGERVLLREHAGLGVESFAFLLTDCPGVFYDLGCGDGAGLHTADFCCGDEVLLPGLALQCAITLRLMNELKK